MALTATVRPDASGSSIPTGIIDFLDTTTNLDLGQVTFAGGRTTSTTSSLALGTHVIRASYSGDGSYVPNLATASQAVVTSILVLDHTASGAIILSANASIGISGSLVVDSNSKTALLASGNTQAKAGSILVVGGVSKSGNAILNPAVITGVAVVPDPLAGLSGPK